MATCYCHVIVVVEYLITKLNGKYISKKSEGKSIFRGIDIEIQYRS